MGGFFSHLFTHNTVQIKKHRLHLKKPSWTLNLDVHAQQKAGFHFVLVGVGMGGGGGGGGGSGDPP